MPSLSTQKRGQRTRHDRSDRQATSSRIRPKKTCRSRWELECDRDRNLADFDRPVEVCEITVPITLKLPAGTASLLRAYARRSGLTIGAIVTRALAAFLSTQRRHG